MFKVGDKVRYIGPTDYFGIKYGDIVILTGHDGVHFYTSGGNSNHEQIFLDLYRLEAVVTTTPHKHAALIKAWADNPQLELQFRGGGLQSNCWYSMSRTLPDWSHSEIRIKPEPKPDVVMKRFLHKEVDYLFAHKEATGAFHKNEVKITFDGETGKLKAVELVE